MEDKIDTVKPPNSTYVWEINSFRNIRTKDGEYKGPPVFTTNFVHESCDQTGLIDSFDSLFLSDSFSDVTIEVDGKELKAHKNILSARSEVFSAMFKHNTVERNENIVIITDFSYDVIKEVLRFIYCGKIENLREHKEDLLVAADKYNLKSLKRVCEQCISMYMDTKNIWEILNMSDLYNCDEMKAIAIDFICDHLDEVINCPEFKEVLEKNPDLIGELLHEAVNKLQTL